MRHIAFTAIAALTLVGCTSDYVASAPIDSTPEPIEKPVTHRCNAAPVQQHVGKRATGEMGETILKESDAKTLRWGPPDSAWTMDYREDRVNVRYDRDMKISAITCG